MALWTVRTSFLKSLSTLTKIATKHIYYVRATRDKYSKQNILVRHSIVAAVARNEYMLCLMKIFKQCVMPSLKTITLFVSLF